MVEVVKVLLTKEDIAIVLSLVAHRRRNICGIIRITFYNFIQPELTHGDQTAFRIVGYDFVVAVVGVNFVVVVGMHVCVR